MKQYVFLFYTEQAKSVVWEEAVLAEGMMEAFLKVKQLLQTYEKEKAAPVRVQYKGVRYRNIDIA
ncbi:hypothetical protein [Anoxybacteroides tepidamans]|uniref:hypothetical protein n=1 Tax=Anoxybacteroides tepidamans TaxID=265948 RepID=UPI000487F884|nr:hypothetical protein [Anoxybacillus tepidamans]